MRRVSRDSDQLYKKKPFKSYMDKRELVLIVSNQLSLSVMKYYIYISGALHLSLWAAQSMKDT